VLVVSALPARGTILPEHLATFLFEIHRRGQRIKIGAALNARRQIVILMPVGMALSINEATQLQKAIREAVIEASLREF
jgi:hypothetical protein